MSTEDAESIEVGLHRGAPHLIEAAREWLVRYWIREAREFCPVQVTLRPRWAPLWCGRPQWAARRPLPSVDGLVLGRRRACW